MDIKLDQLFLFPYHYIQQESHLIALNHICFKVFVTSDVRTDRIDEGWISVITKKTSIKV